jgi:hypothetical protein
MSLTLSPPTYPLLSRIARNMCEQDTSELAALGKRPMPALRRSVRESYECYVALWNGEPQAAFGIATNDSQVGIPWLLTTGDLSAWKRDFWVASTHFIHKWSLMHNVMHNAVDARNSRSIAWLRRLGFNIENTLPLGRGGELFHHMVKRNV